MMARPPSTTFKRLSLGGKGLSLGGRPKVYFAAGRVDVKALRRCPEVYLRYLQGGKNWVELRTPEDCKGWQAREAVDGQPLRYKADLNSGEIWRVDSDGAPRKRMTACPLDKKNPKGYWRISLSFPGSKKRRTFLVHTLLCYAAHGAMPDGCVSVDHINNQRNGNAAYNLVWSSAKQQAANRRPAVHKPLLPFVQEPGEVLYPYLGSPGVAYAGVLPSLVFTSFGRIVRNGKLSQATTVGGGGYPTIKVHGQGMQLVHRLAWAAYYPGKEVPDIINHINHDKLDWSKDNLERSDNSHNATAAHDSGAFAGTQRERQAVRVFENSDGEGEPSGVYESQLAAAKALGITQGSISSSIREKSWFTGTKDGVKTKLWACAAPAPAPAPTPDPAPAPAPAPAPPLPAPAAVAFRVPTWRIPSIRMLRHFKNAAL